MVKPFLARLELLVQANPKDDSIEGLLGYQKRIKGLAKKELLAVARNQLIKTTDRFEALCQVIENEL